MRVLVTGVKGQLGHDVVKDLKKRGHQPIGVDREEMDLMNNESIRHFIMDTRPEAIIHCAAYTAVDKAEEEVEVCYQVNAEAVKVIAECAKELEVKLIYISTDYVFDGTKDGEYVETDTPNPINVYGASKLKGEQYVQELLTNYYIVRISWVFGINGNNFIKTMRRLGTERDELNIIHDQVGSPTYTADLAPLLVDMIETDKYGIYHATNEGFCSWYEFANEIFKQSGIEVKTNPITTDQYPTAAKRPMNSKMSKDKLIKNDFKIIDNWKNALNRYLNLM
ncbi:dTDP-4-dehydrorhamnose reductase [Turicibacter sanguinis]|uniref:dTDP-4-dehydrorhamnose reductase n=1 Tax=Turicibacter sanguinis TaxID=154288 RepID=UPI0018A9CE6C|nr:dTDP-4-dehydrorhamnose reductase [Turicibacter sanguinis]MDB8559585.1 dTDP-4-dehydrorhamnose reductase [Turicibacter sanguinis]MDB8561038.1 dTDP-4-dehydrorhamnose reductase [Turicibacter sanguinis]